MFRFFVLAVIAALANGCCSPDQWEGTQFTKFASSSNGVGYTLDIKGTAHINRTKMMAVFNQTVYSQDGSMFMQMTYQDYTKGMQYYIGQDGKCVMMNITIAEPTCTPKNTAIKTSYLAGKPMMKATLYRFMERGSRNVLTVQDDGCIPISLEQSGLDERGIGYKMTVQMFGITTGIADESVFMVPSKCMM